MGTQQILSPVSAPRVTDRPIAARPATLDGLRIGLLDNQKTNAGRLLDEIRPEVVHFQHITCLSTDLVVECARREMPRRALLVTCQISRIARTSIARHDIL